MNVLSLFDGIACGRLALERAGIQVDNYYASEIDKHAIKVAQDNYPDIVQLGDVNDWESWDLPQIDLIMGGSPCQGFSFAGKRLDFEDPRSKLFFKFVECLEYYQPKYFLLENVRMKKESLDIISAHLGVEPVFINSKIVSAQNRPRYYWSNLPIEQPKDRHVYLKDVLQSEADKKYYIKAGGKTPSLTPSVWESNNYLIESPYQINEDKSCGGRQPSIQDRVYHPFGKSPGVTSAFANRMNTLDFNFCYVRKLTPVECERLQTLPDGYTQSVNESQRYKSIGNAWTVDVVAHILSAINDN